MSGLGWAQVLQASTLHWKDPEDRRVEPNRERSATAIPLSESEGAGQHESEVELAPSAVTIMSRSGY
eukprot:5045317-Pyramimonas_sp.AAC.1